MAAPIATMAAPIATTASDRGTPPIPEDSEAPSDGPAASQGLAHPARGGGLLVLGEISDRLGAIESHLVSKELDHFDLEEARVDRGEGKKAAAPPPPPPPPPPPVKGKRLAAARCILVVANAVVIVLGALVLQAGFDGSDEELEEGVMDMDDGHVKPYILLRGVGITTLIIAWIGLCGGLCCLQGSRMSRALLPYYGLLLANLAVTTWGAACSLLWKDLARKEVDRLIEEQYTVVDGVFGYFPDLLPQTKPELVEIVDARVTEGGIFLAAISVVLALMLWGTGQLMGPTFTSRAVLYASSAAGIAVSGLLAALAIAVVTSDEEGTAAASVLAAASTTTVAIAVLGIFGLARRSIAALGIHLFLLANATVLLTGGAALAVYYPEHRERLLTAYWPEAEQFSRDHTREVAENNMHAVGSLAVVLALLLVLSLYASATTIKDIIASRVLTGRSTCTITIQ